jgi:hypothetical protein
MAVNSEGQKPFWAGKQPPGRVELAIAAHYYLVINGMNDDWIVIR